MLIDRRDAKHRRILSRTKLRFLSVEQDLSCVRHINTGHGFNQRGLARTVFTHERMHLSGAKLKAYLVQRRNAAKAFYDVFQFQNVLTHCVHSSSGIRITFAAS